MYFCDNEFEVGVNDSIFSGNEQQKVYLENNQFAWEWLLTVKKFPSVIVQK